MKIKFENSLVQRFKEPFVLFYFIKEWMPEKIYHRIEEYIPIQIYQNMLFFELERFIHERYNLERKNILKVDNDALYEAKKFAQKVAPLFLLNNWQWGVGTKNLIPTEEEIYNHIVSDMHYIVEKQEDVEYVDCGRIFIHTYEYMFHFYLSVT